MNPWWAKAIVLAASVAMIAIRAPYGHRSRSVQIARSFKGPRENALMTLAWAGFFVPLAWIVTPLLSFADYALHPLPLLAGTLCFTAGLWLLWRSHADLGRHWSITLELRERHELVTNGIYRRVRHPLYLALFVYSVGQLLALPNWIAGPSYLVTFGVLFALRVGPEERMMREQFGSDYESYMARTKRLIPGIW